MNKEFKIKIIKHFLNNYSILPDNSTIKIEQLASFFYDFFSTNNPDELNLLLKFYNNFCIKNKDKKFCENDIQINLLNNKPRTDLFIYMIIDPNYKNKLNNNIYEIKPTKYDFVKNTIYKKDVTLYFYDENIIYDKTFIFIPYLETIRFEKNKGKILRAFLLNNNYINSLSTKEKETICGSSLQNLDWSFLTYSDVNIYVNKFNNYINDANNMLEHENQTHISDYIEQTEASLAKLYNIKYNFVPNKKEIGDTNNNLKILFKNLINKKIIHNVYSKDYGEILIINLYPINLKYYDENLLNITLKNIITLPKCIDKNNISDKYNFWVRGFCFEIKLKQEVTTISSKIDFKTIALEYTANNYNNFDECYNNDHNSNLILLNNKREGNMHLTKFNCYGTYKSALQKATKQIDLFTLINILIQTAQSVTPGDIAGNATLKECVITDKENNVIYDVAKRNHIETNSKINIYDYLAEPSYKM